MNQVDLGLRWEFIDTFYHQTVTSLLQTSKNPSIPLSLHHTLLLVTAWTHPWTSLLVSSSRRPYKVQRRKSSIG